MRLDPALEGKRLFLMRHGKTYEPQLDARMVGPEDDPQLPLTHDGREGVQATARALAGTGIQAAFSSTFARSLDTARIVAAPHGLEVTTRPELEELRIYPEKGGDLRDTARAYVRLARALEARPPEKVEIAPGRETVAAVLDAALDALGNCLCGPERSVLVVAHGGLNRLLLASMMGIPIHRFVSIDQDFACVNVVEFVRRGRPWIRTINATVADPFKGGDLASR